MQNKKYIVKQMIYLMLKKLKEFDCYNEFISNLRQTDDFKNCNIDGYVDKLSLIISDHWLGLEHIDRILNQVSYSFYWCGTKEGFTYWKNIRNKITKYIETTIKKR